MASLTQEERNATLLLLTQAAEKQGQQEAPWTAWAGLGRGLCKAIRESPCKRGAKQWLLCSGARRAGLGRAAMEQIGVP